MKVEVHCIAFNEGETIHLTIKHYQQLFNAHFILYDNHSDDGTPDIARSMGCEVRNFGIPGVLDDREYTRLKNNCWRGSSADWVIIIDADEILLPNGAIKDILSLQGAPLLGSLGWQVFSHDLPKEYWISITNGFYDANYSKDVCFDPKRVKEINYIHGCHVSRPKADYGSVGVLKNAFTLLHYRNVGGPDRLIKRHELYRSRMSAWNKQWGCGVHYTYNDERRKQEWLEQFKKSGPLCLPGGVLFSHETLMQNNGLKSASPASSDAGSSVGNADAHS